MKKDDRNQKSNEKQPWFARFLESQELVNVVGSITHKFPSDDDEPQWEDPPEEPP